MGSSFDDRHSFACRPLGQPCRNFNILGHTVITDPRDGREKLVLSDIRLILLDVLTGEGEEIVKPVPHIAWAVHNWNNEKLIVGTVSDPNPCWIMSLDLRTRQWAEPVQVEGGDSYIWNFARGSDDALYGGTWPKCSLIRYDPATNRAETLGCMSDHPGNQYSRWIYGGAPGSLVVDVISERPHVTVYDIASGATRRLGPDGAAVREIAEDFVCLEAAAGGTRYFFDPRTFEPLDAEIFAPRLTPREQVWRLRKQWTGADIGLMAAAPGMLGDPWRTSLYYVDALSDGSMAGVRGQEYFIKKGDSPGLELKKIPGEPPVTAILEIACDPADGSVWGSCGFGQTIFRLDPVSGACENFPAVCDRGGEVYGMRFIDGKLFMASYAGGDHTILDPKQPWNQYENINPRTVGSCGPELIRPYAKSVIGPDGAFWTGWWAAYGVYGGGLTRVDPATGLLTVWRDLVPEQAVWGLAADDTRVYFTTCGYANGLQTRSGQFCLAAFDPACGEITAKVLFDPDVRPGNTAAAGGFVVVMMPARELRVFKAGTLEYHGSVTLESGPTNMCPWTYEGRRSVAIACGGSLAVFDPATLEVRIVCELPVNRANAMCEAPDGGLFLSRGADIFKVERTAPAK